MTEPNDEHRNLQDQLDEAGRLWRPRHPGWETLVERLPRQEPGEDAAAVRKSADGARRRRSRWVTAAAVVAVLVAVVLGISLWNGSDKVAQAAIPPIEVHRRGIQVTIFSKSEVREPTLFMPLVAPMQTTIDPQQQEFMVQCRGPGTSQHDIEGLTGQFMCGVGINADAGLVGNIPIMQQSPGMALVKDRRMVLHLRKGDNVVKFTDVAATIDPTSVRLVSDTDPMGTKVVEQNFEFDLASADALLKRLVERKIACVGREAGELFEGYLLSFDRDTIVLADKRPSDDKNAPRPKTETISRNKLQAVRIDEMPDDLYTRPTLVWKLRTDKPGDHLTTLTYLCGNAVWRADYVAVITDTTPDEDTIDLKGWVTIDNRSGTTYEDAGLKLIAGDVNRVRDPWAPVPARVQWESEDGGFDDPGGTLTKRQKKEFTQKSFFEYKLYTLNQPSTIKDRQIKQLSLFQATGIKGLRRFVCRSTEGANLHPDVQLLVKNEKKNNLGRPLPKGMMTLTAVDADGDSQLLGRREIDHTPKDEEVEIAMGQAFDCVYGYRVVDTQRPGPYQMIQTYEFRIRNHKPTAIHVRAIGKLLGYSNWKVTKTTEEFTRHDFETLHFDFRLEPDTEKTITYTVDYSW